MSSKAYEEYNYWLGPNEDSNWNEYITEQVARGVLGKFSTDDWKQLNDSILSKEEYWQERSAAALGEQRSTYAIEILKKLLDSSFIEVSIAAASELDWADTQIESKYFERIQAIINTLTREDLESYPELESLLEKAKHSKF
ncbi:HEAT repeat domain-containing protein [Pseudomonas sp. NPDC089534]|uniref:HEAT repeat domain-containing protein n=1 Tax=Pseudomonas sp. NPDC089534 TaxID=3364468 RepID=UPI0038217FD2